MSNATRHHLPARFFFFIMKTYQMYLGLTRPDNEIITTEQFNAYTSEVLDTMFDG